MAANRAAGAKLAQARGRDRVPATKAHEAAKETIESIVVALVLAAGFTLLVLLALFLCMII